MSIKDNPRIPWKIIIQIPKTIFRLGINAMKIVDIGTDHSPGLENRFHARKIPKKINA
jgi:hypothetical protein